MAISSGSLPLALPGGNPAAKQGGQLFTGQVPQPGPRRLHRKHQLQKLGSLPQAPQAAFPAASQAFKQQE